MTGELLLFGCVPHETDICTALSNESIALVFIVPIGDFDEARYIFRSLLNNPLMHILWSGYRRSDPGRREHHVP